MVIREAAGAARLEGKAGASGGGAMARRAPPACRVGPPVATLLSESAIMRNIWQREIREAFERSFEF